MAFPIFSQQVGTGCFVPPALKKSCNPVGPNQSLELVYSLGSTTNTTADLSKGQRHLHTVSQKFRHGFFTLLAESSDLLLCHLLSSLADMLYEQHLLCAMAPARMFRAPARDVDGPRQGKAKRDFRN